MAFIELTKITGGLVKFNVDAIESVEEPKDKNTEETIIRLRSSTLCYVRESYKEVNMLIENATSPIENVTTPDEVNAGSVVDFKSFLVFKFKNLFEHQEQFFVSLQLNVLMNAATALNINNQHDIEQNLVLYLNEVLKEIERQDKPQLFVGLKKAIAAYLEEVTEGEKIKTA